MVWIYFPSHTWSSVSGWARFSASTPNTLSYWVASPYTQVHLLPTSLHFLLHEFACIDFHEHTGGHLHNTHLTLCHMRKLAYTNNYAFSFAYRSAHVIACMYSSKQTHLYSLVTGECKLVCKSVHALVFTCTWVHAHMCFLSLHTHAADGMLKRILRF